LSDSPQLTDPRKKGPRVSSLAVERAVPLRLTGGVAVSCAGHRRPRWDELQKEVDQ
jgi:hypothetical protein